MDIDDVIEELYRKYAMNIQRVCYLYLGNLPGAEDATQETFLKAYEKYDLFRSKSDIKTWLTSIAINTCKDMLRKEKVKNEYIAKEIQSGVSGMADAMVGLNDRAIDRMILSDAIRSLSEELRVVVILFYYQELSTKNISTVLDIPRTTVEFRLKRARKELKRVMKEEAFYG